jgi:hypothetical protein
MNPHDITGMALALGLPSVLASHPGVKQLVREAIANEREACAKVVEAMDTGWPECEGDVSVYAAAIRARGQHDIA